MKTSNSNTIFFIQINGNWECVEGDAVEAMCKNKYFNIMPGSSVELEQCQISGAIPP
jgi:hypothetical protein